MEEAMALPSDVKMKLLSQGRFDPKVPVPPYPAETKLTFHFKTVAMEGEKEGETIDDSRRMHADPMCIVIGKQFKLEIWEKMLQNMTQGQVAEFIVPKQHVPLYPIVSKQLRQIMCPEPNKEAHTHHCCGMMQNGVGFPDLDKLLEKPKDLKFTFDLQKVAMPGTYEQESWQLSESKKLESVPTLRLEGNELFSKGNFDLAEQKYFLAISRLEQLLLKEHPGSEEARELKNQECPLLLNYANCLMKRNEFYEAITHLNSAIKLQPDNVKGLYRLGRCHQLLSDFKEARTNYSEALRLDPSLQKTILKHEEEMLTEQKRLDIEDKKRFKGIFDQK